MLHVSGAELGDRLPPRPRRDGAPRSRRAAAVRAREPVLADRLRHTVGFCFFQCLIGSDRALALQARSADLRQAQLTSTTRDIRIRRERAGPHPTGDLAALVIELAAEPLRRMPVGMVVG